MDIITINPQKCIGCNACIRTCPVPDACVPTTTPEGKTYTAINYSKCINCGECIRSCSRGARDYEDDYEDFIEDMYSKKGKVSLLVDPSIRVAFPDVWQDVLKWFYTQGIRKIYDVSFGADIATWAQVKLLGSNSSKKYITSTCSSVISYAQKHDPSLFENLSPVQSPAVCMAIYAKRQLRDGSDFAYFGPCPGRKEEFEDTGYIKYNVTFKRMKEFFDKRKISFSNTGQGFSFEFSHKQGLMGSLYTKPKGVKEALRQYRTDLNISNCDGITKTYYQLKNYSLQTPGYVPDALEILSCYEGCNAGAGVEMEGVPSLGVISKVMDITRKDIEKRQNGIFGSKSEKIFKEFDKELKLELYLREYSKKMVYPRQPTINDLNNIFNSMNKKSMEDKQVDCCACGYKTCHEMANAIFNGANVRENCIYYLRSLPSSENAYAEEFKKAIATIEVAVKNNSPAMMDSIAIIRKEAVSIFSNNQKTADAAKTINSVIEQMIEACNNPKGVSRETISEISSTLELMRKILNNLSKFVTKNSESGYSIDNHISSIENITKSMAETVDMIVKNNVK